MVFTFGYTGYILLDWATILHHSAPYAVLGPRFPPRKPPQAPAQPPSPPSIDIDAVTKRGTAMCMVSLAPNTSQFDIYSHGQICSHASDFLQVFFFSSDGAKWPDLMDHPPVLRPYDHKIAGLFWVVQLAGVPPRPLTF